MTINIKLNVDQISSFFELRDNRNIEHVKEVLNKDGYEVEISSGEATSERDGKIRRWKNIFLPSSS